MGANDRIVQHLHLRAPSAQAAGRALNRLEDALRCASLPDAGERVLLVRRLHLGRLPAGPSSQSLALLIEQRVAALGGTWVHGDDPRAGKSDTVFFASRLQAAQAAVLRRAKSQSLDAWYWPLALPGLQVNASDPTFLKSVVSVLACEPSAPVSLPALVADIVAAGHAPWLLSATREETVTLLLSVGDTQHHVAQVLQQQRTSAPSQAVRYTWRSLAGRQHQTWIPVAWSAWLHALLRLARWFPESVPQETVRSELARRATDHGVGPQRGAASHSLSGGQEHLSPADVWGSLDFDMPVPITSGAVTSNVELPVAEGFERVVETVFDTTHPTRAGGLLFLVNLLVRLGFGEWQLRHPDAPLCGLILSKALQRLDVTPEDPAWGLAASLPCPSRPLVCRWEIPAVWCDNRIAVVCDAAKAHTADEMASMWLVACRRYLRRVEHIGLFSCVCRAAQLHWSASHLDTFFDLRATDLRVRRSALDLDPAWLPWLGRVVSFHYQHEGRA